MCGASMASKSGGRTLALSMGAADRLRSLGPGGFESR